MVSRSFRGVWIPREIWLDENLTMTDKAVYVEVDSLSTSEQGCYASNEYLAKFCGCSVSKITKSISKLSKLGYLISEGTGKQRKLKKTSYFLRGNLVKSTRKPSKKYEENNIDNNIDNNIINNSINISNINVPDINTMSHFSNEGEDEEKKSKPKKVFGEKEDPYLLAKYLENNIAVNNPNFPKSEKQKQRWANDIDKMIRIDKIKPDDIANIISFCQKDSFWKCNILSGKKLREKYHQLLMKMISQEQNYR